jgi:predicted nucleotidyltransferase
MKRRVGRPLKGLSKRLRVSFTIPSDQGRWLTSQSQIEGISKSDLLEKLIDSGIRARIDPTTVHLRNDLGIPRSVLGEFCRRNAVRRVSLFGSVLREDFRSESDVDILVEFEPGRVASLFKMTAMESELSALIGRKVDLRTEGELGRHIRSAVAREAREIYGRPS